MFLVSPRTAVLHFPVETIKVTYAILGYDRATGLLAESSVPVAMTTKGVGVMAWFAMLSFNSTQLYSCVQMHVLHRVCSYDVLRT